MPKVAVTAVEMISGMTPEAQPGTFVFVSTGDPAIATRLTPKAVSIFREREGTSLLVPREVAEEAGLNVDQPMRCITLNVYSSLEGVGLTAAVSAALADNAIPCNMIAAFHHDHVFVPEAMCENAIQVLNELQTAARRDL